MTQEQVLVKLAKLQILTERGIDDERAAAKKAFERLVKKYNISSDKLKTVGTEEYRFKYSSQLEIWLIQTLTGFLLLHKEPQLFRDTRMKREIVVRLEYGDWALLDCAYEYYRRHMKAQFKKLCSPQINRCRKAKAKDRRRKELQQLFFSQYVIASKLYKENELVRLDTEAMTRKECADRLILQGIEGGDYKTQLNKGLYLEN